MLAAGWTVALVVLRFLAARAPLLGIEVRPETRPTPRPPRRFDPPSTGRRLGRYHPSASAAGITHPPSRPAAHCAHASAALGQAQLPLGLLSVLCALLALMPLSLLVGELL